MHNIGPYSVRGLALLSQNRYLQSNTQYMYSMQLVKFDIEKVHIDIVCTIFNAVMHSAASFLLKTLLSNNEDEFMQCVSDLQAAGY